MVEYFDECVMFGFAEAIWNLGVNLKVSLDQEISHETNECDNATKRNAIQQLIDDSMDGDSLIWTETIIPRTQKEKLKEAYKNKITRPIWKKHSRMMLDSIDNAPLVYPTVKENRQTRLKKYSELTEEQKLQDDYDVQDTNIILHGLPSDVMTMQQVQVNTKFMNALPLEWSKFVTDQGEYPIECVDKVMAFLSAIASRFPPSNNQLRTSSNPRNQATIQDGRVTVQQIQRRQTQSFAGTGNRGNDTNFRGTNAAGQPQDVQAMMYSEQIHIVDSPDNEIHSDSNIIPDSQYLQETQDAGIQDTNPSTPNDLLILSLVEQIIDQVANLDKENQTNKMLNESLSADLERYKERVAIFEQRQNCLELDGGNKIHKVPTASEDFPLPEQLPTANEDKFPLLIQSDATVDILCTTAKVKE
nr:hypothetical protein [Tanacetum cinerariifolium]